MSDSSGNSQSHSWEWAVCIAIVICAVIWFLYPGGPSGFLEWAGTKTSEITSSSQVITACKKSSRDGVYTITDQDDMRYEIANKVRRGQKTLTAKQAYGVFKEGRAFRVRVSIASKTIGEHPKITWIESASKELEAAECSS